MRLFGKCWGIPINGVACSEHPEDYPHNFAVGTMTIGVLVVLAVLLSIAIGIPLGMVL